MNWPCAPANPGWLHMSMDHDSYRLGFSGSHGRRDSALVGSYTGASSWTVLCNLTWNMELPTTILRNFCLVFSTNKNHMMTFMSKWMTFWLRIIFLRSFFFRKDIVYCMYPWIIFSVHFSRSRTAEQPLSRCLPTCHGIVITEINKMQPEGNHS